MVTCPTKLDLVQLYTEWVGKWPTTDILSSDEDTTNIPYFSIEFPVYNEHRGDQALD